MEKAANLDRRNLPAFRTLISLVKITTTRYILHANIHDLYAIHDFYDAPW